MKKYIVHLSREYIVHIDANNEDDARKYAEEFVSGGFDDSKASVCNKLNFKIQKIIPTLNETHYVEQVEKEVIGQKS